jgi:hypothetical protein
MFEKIKAKLKNKGFWAGMANMLAGILGGALTIPDAIIQFIGLIGG